MNQFLLQHGSSRELESFPHVLEFAIRKNTTIQLNSLRSSITESLRMYYVLEGKFEWVIEKKHHILYPGELAIILPGQSFHGAKDFLEIGTLFWIHIKIDSVINPSKTTFGSWSGISENDCRTILRIFQLNNALVLVKMQEACAILYRIQTELFQQQIGYQTRINQMLDELLILAARQSTHQNNTQRDFPQTFVKLEQELRNNLAHQWTVDEMAAMMGLGATAFTEKVKNYTGFSPLNYLINLRISEAMKLLRKGEVKVTAIAFETGFYSSQHFSTTFKKLTGYTPGDFRKKDAPKK